MKEKISSIIVLALLLTNCQPESATTAEADPTPEIRQQWDQFIVHWEQEEAEQLAGFYIEDGRNIPPGFKINAGRDQITNFYKMLFDNNISSEYQHEIKSLSRQGKQAVEYGEFTVDWVGNDSSTWTFKARSLTHWEQSEQGTWLIKTFLFNQPPQENSPTVTE